MPAEPPTFACSHCPLARIFRTLDALYNHRVDLHGDLFRFTIIDGLRASIVPVAAGCSVH
jgi:hypothetical protein